MGHQAVSGKADCPNCMRAPPRSKPPRRGKAWVIILHMGAERPRHIALPAASTEWDRPAPALPHQHLVDDPESYRFCPKCSDHLETRLIKNGEPARKICRSCQFILYFNPKVAAGTICLLENKLLLLQRAIEPGYGKWVFPGGYVDRGETLEAAALREAREEANVDVRLDRLLKAYSYPGRAVVIVVFVGTVVGGEPMARDEALDLRAVSPRDIPWDHLAFPSTRDALRDFTESLGY